MSLTLARLGVVAGSFPVLSAGDFESIATVTVGSGGSATAVFDNIPDSYQHLMLRIVARNTRAGYNTNTLYLQYNTDTSSANYVRQHTLNGDGSTASVSAQASGVIAQNAVGTIPAASASANIFGASLITILDYASTSKYKTVRTFAGEDRNGAGSVDLISGLWMSTAKISKITVGCSADSLAQYSTLALYGIKAP